jgi:hypothetical protein
MEKVNLMKKYENRSLEQVRKVANKKGIPLAYYTKGRRGRDVGTFRTMKTKKRLISDIRKKR